MGQGMDEGIPEVEDRFDSAQAEIMRLAYLFARGVRVGKAFPCPSCSRWVVKRSYQHIFCSNRGRGNCKDYYWNRVDPDRLDRAVDMLEGER